MKARSPDSKALGTHDQPVRGALDAQGGSEGLGLTGAAGEPLSCS